MRHVAAVLAAGYLVLGRSFAYLGVSPFYPAEAYLLLAVWLSPGRWVRLLSAELFSGGAVAWWALLFLFWGAAETLRGIEAGRETLIALKSFSAHYYPLFLFIGVALGRRLERPWLERYVLAVGALAGAHGIVYAIYTSRLDLFLPWAREVPMFTEPPMLSYLIVALVAFLPSLGKKGLVVLIICILAVLAIPGRASWLSLIVGCGTVFIVQRQWKLMFRLGSALVVTLLLLVFIGEEIPASETRGGTLDIRWIAAQVVASFDPDWAFRLVSSSSRPEDALIVYARHGTIGWRYVLWNYVLASLASPSDWLLGHGYGIELAGLAHHEQGLRSTHNFILYLLGYTGLVGVALYMLFSVCLVWLFVRLPASPVRSFLLGQFAAVWILAMFGNTLETPFAAVPFYLVMGLAYGIASVESVTRRPVDAQENPVRGPASLWFDAASGRPPQPH